MTHDALSTLLPIAGWLEERARAVEFTGGTDPILPTPFRISETGAATLAAVTLPASVHQDRLHLRDITTVTNSLRSHIQNGSQKSYKATGLVRFASCLAPLHPLFLP